MPTSKEDYAFLSEVVYLNNLEINTSPPGSPAPSGATYNVLYTINDPRSGYFGAVFQNAETKEIIVAHRGTEFGVSFEAYLDLIITDAQMGFVKLNQQTESAARLVQWALQYQAENSDVPSIAMTGHSLGGALTQIMASRYQIPGVTFNAYGAVGVSGTTAGGENLVTNYVRASDVVSALNSHFGRVLVYAAEDDRAFEFWNLANLPANVLLGLAQSHTIAQFYDQGGEDGVLTDENRDRYSDFSPIYDLYREELRVVATSAPGILANLPSTALSIETFRRWLTARHNENVDAGVTLGTAGSDAFNGTEGDDSLFGGLGDDIISGGSKSDFIHGGDGNDTLRGGSGNDIIFGWDGNDYLDGGSGSDSLYGGNGNDRYNFSISDFVDSPGKIDKIIDLDGQGAIEVNNVTLSIGERLNEYSWRSVDGNFEVVADLSKSEQTLIIKHAGTGSTIQIENWHPGDLGINLPSDPVEPPPATGAAGDGLYDQAADDSDGERVVVADVIDGTGGNDAIDGGLGDDTIRGGAGDDLLLAGAGENKIEGGAGNDFIYCTPLTVKFDHNTNTQAYADWRSNVTNTWGGAIAASGNGWFVRTTSGDAYDPNQVAPVWYFFDIYQSAGFESSVSPLANDHPNGQDIVDAGDGNDFVSSGEGNDIVDGGAGNDMLYGGADHDNLSGGLGNDWLWGDTSSTQGNQLSTNAVLDGNDILRGDAGDDVLFGEKGNDFLDGGADKDKLYGAAGDDRLQGGDGDDYLEGDALTNQDPNAPLSDLKGDDYLDGGAGNDLIHGGGGADTIEGGTGDDQIDGDYDGGDRSLDGNDTIYAGDGNDLALGGGANDFVGGGAGNDQLYGDSSGIPEAAHGNDMLDGGEGDDRLWGQGGNDQLSGGVGNDRLDGGTGNDALSGGDGNDFLDGRAGLDSIDGGLGDDEIWGGSGADRLSGGDGHDYIDGGFDDDVIFGGAGNDQLHGGGDGNDVIDGGAGRDGIDGEYGDDQLSGGDGDDIVLGGMGLDSIKGGSGNDQLQGQWDGDNISGGEGHDYLSGDDGNDVLGGDAGDDQLLGGLGDDQLTGGAGDDVLSGGRGNDIFVFGAGFGKDAIVGSLAVQGETDVLRFEEVTSLEQMQFVRIGDDLNIAIAGTLDAVRVVGFFNGRDYRVELSGGASLTQANVAAMPALIVLEGEPNTGTYSDTPVGSVATTGWTTVESPPGPDTYVLNQDPLRPKKTFVLNSDGTDVFHVAGAFLQQVTATFVYLQGLTITISGYCELVLRNAGPWYGTDFILEFEDGTQFRGSDIVALAYRNYIDSLIQGGGPGYVALTPTMFAGLPAFEPWFNEGSNEGQFFGPRADTVTSDGSEGWLINMGGGADSYRFANPVGSKIIWGDEAASNGYYQGNDQIIQVSESLGTSWSGLIFAMGGNDVVYAGTSLPNASIDAVVIDGGDGNDIIYGRPENYDPNLIYKSVISGGSGNDTLCSGGESHIEGGAGDDTIVGGSSWDLIHGGEGSDTITGAGGNDNLYGDSGNDQIFGGDGADNLNGGAGADQLCGGTGNDRYAPDALDVLQELPNEGYDTIEVNFDYALQENIEQLVLLGNLAANGTGNQQDNYLVGNSANNFLRGLSGHDQLLGGGGDDVLEGGEGDDYLRGDAGVDRLEGGAGQDWIAFGNTDIADGGEGDDVLVADWNAVVNATLRFHSGGGNDSIDLPNLDGSTIVIQLPDYSAGQASIRYEGNSLIVSFGGQDSLRIQNYSAVTAEVRFEFADGTTWSRANMPPQTLMGTDAADNLRGNDRDDRIYGLGGDDQLDAYGGNNYLDGGAGSDELWAWQQISSEINTFVGGAGDDLMGGGEYQDIYRFALGDGRDEVWEWGDFHDVAMNTFEFGSGISPDALVATRVGPDLVISYGENDAITIKEYFILYMDQGQDPWTSRVGTFRFEDGTVWGVPQIEEWLNACGVSNAPFISDYNIESGASTLTGTALNDFLELRWGKSQLYGLAGNDRLVTGATDDLLDGGQGNDVLLGGTGGDRYVLRVGDGSDTITDDGEVGDGDDILDFVDIASTDVRNVQQDGVDLVIAYSTSDEVRIVGYFANDLLKVEQICFTDSVVWGQAEIQKQLIPVTFGTESADVLWAGSDQPARISGLGGDDILRGRGGNDLLMGGEGKDTLNGGAGLDTMLGGAGNDTYVVDRSDDVVTELNDEGTDTIQASASYVLGENVENLVLTGTLLIDGTGNDLANRLTGNAADNVLDGRDGDDVLAGGDGSDRLLGGAGKDTLNGGVGLDTMLGGSDNDTYIVDSSDDVVIELIDDGTDIVNSTVNYVLSDNVENLVLTGAAAINGMGNSLANRLTGNANDNVLDGGGGDDVLVAGGGNDQLIGGQGVDTLSGGNGSDRYEFNLGDGKDTIIEANAHDGTEDVLAFGAGIDADELWFERTGNDLLITVLGTQDSIRVKNWYSDIGYDVEKIVMSDGKFLTIAETNALVSAMAGYVKPSVENTSIPEAYRADLMPQIVANW